MGDGPQPSALPPCQASRESAKQSVFGASRAAGGPRKHRAPKKQGARFTRGEGGWGVFRVENEGCAVRQQRGLRITAAQQSLCKGL